MSAITFDTLRAARRLKEAGVPPQQAEAQAEIMAEAFVQNVDNLVTRDYLDVRLAQQDAQNDVKFEVINGKFRVTHWMLGLLIITTSIPLIQGFVGG